MLTHPFASDLEETSESSELTITTAAIGEEGGEPIPIVEGKPKISIQNAEGFEEEGIITVNVILDRPSLERVTVKYLTFDYDQGAKAWKDFIPEKSHLVFEPGETEKQISIKLNDDQLGEFSKSLAVKLFKAKNAKIDDGVAIVELKDGDELADSNLSQPLISINNQTTLLELQASELEFSIFLDEASEQEVVINYKTFEISAQADTDFIPQTGSLTFSAV